MNATIRDVMNTRVIALKRTADFKEIVSVLRQHGVSACPVLNDAGQVIGGIKRQPPVACLDQAPGCVVAGRLAAD